MQPGTNETAKIISANWQRVCEQVNAACAESSRSPDEVSVVGVSKYVGPELALQLVQAGCRILGENRPQSLWEKAEYFAARGESRNTWHMIGHLQRNKIRRTLPLIECLHSLDSARLAQAVNHEAQTAGVKLKTLVEVNVTRDEAKTGLPADQLCQLLELAEQFTSLHFVGLMAMSSYHAEAQQARGEFALVRQLRDEMTSKFPHLSLPELSMGMSGDYREAIAEGATLVRIGSSLWVGLLES